MTINSAGHERQALVEPSMPASLVWLLAVSSGCIVANIYYAQPLLPDIARTFDLTVTRAGAVAMIMQLGTALGMLWIVPLGDKFERRSLICTMLCIASGCLALTAASRTFPWLCIASFALGLAAATTHVIVPLAAHLAPARERGRVVGSVLSGLLMGILLSRTLSGFVGARMGWRAIYWIAAGLMIAVALVLRTRLPQSRPATAIRWADLMRSVLHLAREHRQLREAALLGALFFCAFSAFWTTLAFFLATPPFHYGSGVAGAFGLIGAAGAAGAPAVGTLSDRYGPRRTLLVALLTTLLAFVVMWMFGRTLMGLVIGVLLMDLGVQAGHVANQTRIYALAPHARSRLNTVYMVCYFIGGATGSYCGAACWRAMGWSGVCGVAIIALCVALLAYIHGSLRGKAVAAAAAAGPAL